MATMGCTLATPRYADRAKSIQLKAVKNEQMSEVGHLRSSHLCRMKCTVVAGQAELVCPCVGWPAMSKLV